MVAKSIGECEEQTTSTKDKEAEDAMVSTSDEIDVEINSEVIVRQQVRKGSKTRKRRVDEKSDISDDDSASGPVSDSDSSPEIYRVRPTRSGRQPKKMKKLQAPNINKLNMPKIDAIPDSDAEKESSVTGEDVIPSHVAVEVTEIANTSTEDSETTETPCPENITNVIPNINQMEPGSLVIVSKESTEEPGNTILQVYMVSSNVNNVDNVDNVDTTMKSDESMVDQQNVPEPLTTTKLETAEPELDTVENSEA